MTYLIYINDCDFMVWGTEAAYMAYLKACDFADMFGFSAALVDAETGEILADNLDED